MLPELVDDGGEWEYVEGPAQQDEDDAPHDEGRLQLEGEAEEGQAKVGEHARLANEGDRTHGLLHGDLRKERDRIIGKKRRDSVLKRLRHTS